MMDTGRMEFRIGLVMVCLVVGVTAGSMALFADPADAQPSLGIQPDGFDADEIRINIGLHEDGSAEWSLEFWSALDDEESTEAFESLQADIETDPKNYSVEFSDRIGTTVATANNATSREMAADNFSVTTDRQSLGREYGIVRYSFDWSGFARTEDRDLYAGDAIEGLYIDDGTRLLVSWPAEYELQSATPEPDDRRETAVIWHGSSTDFVSGEPRLVFSPAETGFGLGTIAIVLATVGIVLGVAGWLLRRRSTEAATQKSTGITTQESEQTAATESTATSTGESTGTDTESSTPASTETPTKETPAETSPVDDQESKPDETRPTQPAETKTESDDTDSESELTDSESEPDTDSEPNGDTETALLSNEEQVMKLLEANGGRMKQQTVVTELGWTDAKTSKVVSALREAGTIESFRIGRENVLRVPESDTESGSL